MNGECMFNPPDNPTGRRASIYDFVRPVVKCADYCHNCVGRDQTGGTCRHCKWFRVFKEKK